MRCRSARRWPGGGRWAGCRRLARWPDWWLLDDVPSLVMPFDAEGNLGTVTPVNPGPMESSVLTRSLLLPSASALQRPAINGRSGTRPRRRLSAMRSVSVRRTQIDRAEFQRATSPNGSDAGPDRPHRFEETRTARADPFHPAHRGPIRRSWPGPSRPPCHQAPRPPRPDLASTAEHRREPDRSLQRIGLDDLGPGIETSRCSRHIGFVPLPPNLGDERGNQLRVACRSCQQRRRGLGPGSSGGGDTGTGAGDGLIGELLVGQIELVEADGIQPVTGRNLHGCTLFMACDTEPGFSWQRYPAQHLSAAAAAPATVNGRR